MKFGRTKDVFSRKLAWVIAIIFIISLGSIPAIRAFADKERSTKIIKVLEIQPGNKFNLKTDEANGVYVTQMDMPTFISKVDEINGQYDVVYIGRNNTGLIQEWSTTAVYRDYSVYNSQLWGNDIVGSFENARKASSGEDANEKQFNERAKILWYGLGGAYPSRTDPLKLDWATFTSFENYTSSNKGLTSTFKYNDNNYTKNMKEYYSENDITKKRAKEITKLIESNQLVYIDNGIFGISSNNSSNLETIFKEYKDNNSDYPNTHFLDEKLTVNTIKDDYSKLHSSLKAPEIEMISTPNGDKNNTSSMTQEQKAKNRNLIFKFKLNSELERNYRAKLYLDYDGDGSFLNDRYVYCDVVKDTEEDVYKVEYTVSSTFIGYLDWKLQIVDAENEDINRYVTGSVIFNNILGEAVTINVLQLMPDNECNLNMATNHDFITLVNELNKEGNYKLKIQAITIDSFNKSAKDNVVNCYNSLKEQFNMIVLGFADNYGNGYYNQFNSNAIDVLKLWNNAEKSLLFTHDTMNLSVLDNSKSLENSNVGYDFTKYSLGSRSLTQAFRSEVGQARYIDPFNMTEEESKSFIDNEYLSLGITAFANVKLYSYYTMTEEVYNVNESQITSYPYDLTESLNNNGSMAVSKTHTQWFQLDLEDEEVVPIYNLRKDELINKGDARNFYYTYSKGNITYSGAGHSKITSIDEMKLFINTMVKAIRGANEKPVVTNMDENKVNVLDGTTVEVPNTDDFNFVTKIKDDSNVDDIVSISIKTEDGLSLTDVENITFVAGIEDYYVNCTIPSDYIYDSVDKKIKVIATATDKYGETSDIKTFYIKVVQGKEDLDTVHGVDISTDDSIWSSDTVLNNINNNSVKQNYYAEVPFAGYVRMYNSNATLDLELDSSFINTSNVLDNGFNASTVLNNNQYEPVVYVVKEDGKLARYGAMKQTSNTTFTIDLDKNQISSLGYVDEGYCKLVVKYKCKTYNHITEDGAILNYNNKLTISKNGKDLDNKIASVFVQYKALDGDLF